MADTVVPEEWEEETEAERVYGWRMRVLIFAGCPVPTAERIAGDTSIDLHYAESLLRRTGAELAERILL